MLQIATMVTTYTEQRQAGRAMAANNENKGQSYSNNDTMGVACYRQLGEN